jgi:flagellar motor switch protein FliM
MAAVLTQQEIDALLAGISAGTVEVDQLLKEQPKQILPYDFRRPNRISKTQLRSLQSIHETFAETAAYYLLSRLQALVSISVVSVDQLFYSEYLLTLSRPSCLYVFELQGTERSGIIELSPQLALLIVERLLGGDASTPPQKARTITPIEQAVLKGVMEHLLRVLEESWQMTAQMRFRLLRLETQPDFLQIASASEIVVVIGLQVNVGIHTYAMSICYPTFALEDVLSRLERPQVVHAAAPEQQRQSMLVMYKHLQTIPLEVSVELGRTTITVGELLRLKVGDVLRLDTPVTAELPLLIQGQYKLWVRPGRIGEHRAVRVIRPIEPEEIG